MLVGLALLGCTDAQIVREREGGVDAPPVDAGPDTALPDGCVPGMVTMGEPAGCMLERWPARPVCSADAMDVGLLEAALLNPQLTATGFDLDGVCTGVGGTPPSCAGSMLGDGSAQGVDNAFASEIVPGIGLVVAGFDTLFMSAVTEGRGTPLLRIEGWNGEPDDAQVTASMGAAAVMPPVVPAWDGTDVIPVADTSFSGGVPVLQDTSAYVAGGVLVMEWPTEHALVFESGGRAIRMLLRDARLVAEIDFGVGLTVTNAQIVGRWASSDAIASLDDLGLCEGSTDPMVVMLRTMALLLFDGSVDVAAREANDELDGMSPCVAISVALGFGSSATVAWGAEAPAITATACP